MSEKIILGTAKIGIDDYGFSSKNKQSKSEKLLSKAKNLGIVMLDTSPRYGNAESIIGNYHDNNEFKFLISTKVDSLLRDDLNSEYKICHSVEKSINRMQISSIDTKKHMSLNLHMITITIL